MSQHATPHLNAARRRARKRVLARRDGRRCTYCRAPFAADLRNATFDHVVPLSLFRTWSAAHLVLACRSCNTAKGSRLPLSFALLLCAQSADREHPTRAREQRAGAVFTPVWPLLARLAYARQSADRSADCAPERGERSTPDQPIPFTSTPDRPKGNAVPNSKEPTTPVCRGCGDEAVNRPPKAWRSVDYPRPDWSHADGTPLCPIPDPNRPDWWGPYGTKPVWRPSAPDRSGRLKPSTEEGAAA
ncbi:HNH endonuclease [Streptomyces sp. NPDC048644]|uniref:HNH endonuclease n=1 Tax=Streptomyces sp. NPDC048644 TaxID=3365582 RepID=UPI0037114516